MSAPLVEVRELRRTYRVRPRRPGLRGAIADLFTGPTVEVPALDGVDLSLSPGEVLGYIGPNGAGKSTTIKCLTGILKPTSGTVRVAGLDPWRDRRRHLHHVGVVFGQRTQLWWDLAVQEAFDLLAAVFRVPDAVYRRRLAELVALLDLDALVRLPVRELSLGQRVRCDLAAALLHAPRLVLLDEPTIGLDVAVKRRIREFVRGMVADRGVGVLLTTHDLGDVEELCDRVLLIDRGRVVFDGDLPGLRERLGGARVLVVETGGRLGDADLEALAPVLPGVVARRSESAFEVRFGRDTNSRRVIGAVLDRTDPVDLALEEPSIEEIVARFYESRR